jgi:hypothetical protein
MRIPIRHRFNRLRLANTRADSWALLRRMAKEYPRVDLPYQALIDDAHRWCNSNLEKRDWVASGRSFLFTNEEHSMWFRMAQMDGRDGPG